MTVAEQRAVDAVIRGIPSLLRELRRGNELRALSIRLGIESERANNAAVPNLDMFENELSAIMA